ncbi:MAG TPA: TetR family transcriptional regulator [Trebonia sp.]
MMAASTSSVAEVPATPPTRAPAAPPHTPCTEPPASLRERKKLATRRLLSRVALDLVAERGLVNVTVEDIAESAEVSPRTFFNYFPSKEAALFGGGDDPGRAEELRARIASESPGEPALTVLRTVMSHYAEVITDEFRSLGGDPADWLRRIRVAREDPHVRAAHAAQMSMIERAIGEGLATRLGADPETDPYPWVLAAAAVGVVRACTGFWASSGGTVSLSELIGQAFQSLACGLPEHGALRQVMTDAVGTADRKDHH